MKNRQFKKEKRRIFSLRAPAIMMKHEINPVWNEDYFSFTLDGCAFHYGQSPLYVISMGYYELIRYEIRKRWSKLIPFTNYILRGNIVTMKYQPKYQIGDRVLYNSLLCAGAANGTVQTIDNDKIPHVYTIKPDSLKDKSDVVEEYHIIRKHD